VCVCLCSNLFNFVSNIESKVCNAYLMYMLSFVCNGNELCSLIKQCASFVFICTFCIKFAGNWFTRGVFCFNIEYDRRMWHWHVGCLIHFIRKRMTY
jgi:hypothetical protein